MSDADHNTLREFVLFCFERRRVGWPALYDEMCYVASHRLYRDMGYEELREAGLDFTLVGLQQLARLAQEVAARPGRVSSAAS